MALNLNRGETYWVNLDPTKGSEIRKMRPCVLVGVTPINRARRTVVVIPLSSSERLPRPPLTVQVTCMNKPAVAVCDQVRAVDKTRLVKHIGSLSRPDLAKIDSSLKQILSL